MAVFTTDKEGRKVYDGAALGLLLDPDDPEIIQLLQQPSLGLVRAEQRPKLDHKAAIKPEQECERGLL